MEKSNTKPEKQKINMDSGIFYWFFNSSQYKAILVVFFFIAFGVTAADGLWGLYCSFKAIVFMDHTMLNSDLFLFSLRALLPLAIWVLSTGSERFTYKKIRQRAWLIVMLHSTEVVMEMILRSLIIIGTSLLLYIPVNGNVSTTIVVYAGYYCIGVPYIVISVFSYRTVILNSLDKFTQKRINSFYLSDYFSDFYVKKKHSYTLEFIRYLDTGRKYIISMPSRYLHTFGLGVTGTGKTSSCVSVALAHDFLIKAQNIDIQKKIVRRWIEQGNVRVKEAFDDDDFNLCYFEGCGKKKEAYDKKLSQLAKKIPNAGMTIMCPNASFADEVYDIAVKKGFRVNRVDPSYGANGAPKDGCVGMNPLYVNPEELDSNQEKYFEKVIQAATLFAEVNQAIFDQSGRSDPYFAGVNKNMSVCAAVILIIAVPLREHRVATVSDVLRVLNTFDLMKGYRDKIIDRFGISNKSLPGTKEYALGKAQVGDTLQQYIDSVDLNFLGDNKANMNEQCTGLRNIIQDSISIPRVKKLINATNTIDFDEMLSRSEITIINFDLSLGQDVSASFGLFFLLNFINAVLRRDGRRATPHFFFIDEAHVLLHPRMTLCATLFRQYKVGCMFFMQSLTQFDNTEVTKPLKNVFMGNMAHHVVFGRAALEEMRHYSELAGTEDVIEHKEQTRESTITMADTSLQTSMSDEVIEKDKTTETDIRYLRFLECTVISVRRNMPLPVFKGKVNFLNEKNGGYIKRDHYDWAEYYDHYTVQHELQAPEMNSFTITSSTRTNMLSNASKAEEITPPAMGEVSGTVRITTSTETVEPIDDRLTLSTGDEDEEPQKPESNRAESDTSDKHLDDDSSSETNASAAKNEEAGSAGSSKKYMEIIEVD